MTIGSILCCDCGVLTRPSATNKCARCLRSSFSITDGLQKHVVIHHCPNCERYLQPPRAWIHAQPESNELLAFCLKRLKIRQPTRLVGGEFVFTEAHCKRIKVKVTVWQWEVGEQSYVVEYVVCNQLCESCTRIQANPDQWVAVVQLRQHVAHRRTFFYLEQLILTHDAAKYAIRIKQMKKGVDFFFSKYNHAMSFAAFVGHVSLVKRGDEAKVQVSHDAKSNNYNNKYTLSVEICPVCREDLICLPPELAGSFGPLVICSKVTNRIALLDPFTLRGSFLYANQYWGLPFKSLLSSRQLVEYIVLDIEVVSPVVEVDGKKYALADAQVARVSDFGKNDMIFYVRTHLGHLLKPGDYALGYDLYGANINDIHLEKYKKLALPDVMLIKKSYEEKRRGKPRSWRLRYLNMEVDDSARGRDNEERRESEYEQFLRDLEENPDLTFNLSLYRNEEYPPSGMASVTNGEDLPSVRLEELFTDLDLDDEHVEEDLDDEHVEEDDGMEE